MFGKDLMLKFSLPDGREVTMQAKESNEAGYIRLLLAKQEGLDARNIRLVHKGKPLIDPLSLCDHPGIAPPTVDLQVEFL